MRAHALTAAIALSISLVPRLAPAQEKTPPLDITSSLKADRIRQLVAGEMSVPMRRYGGAHSEVVLTPRFLFVRDTALTLPTPPFSDEGAYAAAFQLARDAWYSVQSDRIRLIMVFSTFKDGGESLFYLPMANDVQGLGEGVPATVFDDTPGLQLDGFAWLGNLAALEDVGHSDVYLQEAFVHEIAHRWSAYAKLARPGLASDVLRGRQSMHWSFLVDSLGSPMEGNAWTKRTDGYYVTTFGNPPDLRFSPLDLYLMGVLAPEEVPAFRVITTWTVVQPTDMTVSKDTAPAHRSGRAVVLDAYDTQEVTIEDVVAGSGPRTPAAADRPVVWPVGVVLLSSGIEKTPLEDLAHLEEKLGELVGEFAHATGGRMTLDVHVAGAGAVPKGGLCATLDVCHRTESDRCVAVHAGDEATCERSCSADSPCGDGACCGLAGDGTTHICVRDAAACTSPTPAQSEGPGQPDTVPPDSPPLAKPSEDRSRGCVCTTATTEPPAWLLALSALFIARRRRTT